MIKKCHGYYITAFILSYLLIYSITDKSRSRASSTGRCFYFTGIDFGFIYVQIHIYMSNIISIIYNSGPNKSDPSISNDICNLICFQIPKSYFIRSVFFTVTYLAYIYLVSYRIWPLSTYPKYRNVLEIHHKFDSQENRNILLSRIYYFPPQ